MYRAILLVVTFLSFATSFGVACGILEPASIVWADDGGGNE